MSLRAKLKVPTELVLLQAPVRMPPLIFQLLESAFLGSRPLPPSSRCTLPPASGLTSFLALLPWCSSPVLPSSPSRGACDGCHPSHGITGIISHLKSRNSVASTRSLITSEVTQSHRALGIRAWTSSAPHANTFTPSQGPKISTHQCQGFKSHHPNRRRGFDPWVGKIPWRRTWQPTPVPLPGESHGERSLVGYSPWGRKESDTTERLTHRRL